MIELTDLRPAESETWGLLFDLAEDDAEAWVLIGGQMVLLLTNRPAASTFREHGTVRRRFSDFLVVDVEEAIELGRSIPGARIMGEDHGRKPPGFDLSNSPVAVSR
jgi:hypothetical protein